MSECRFKGCENVALPHNKFCGIHPGGVQLPVIKLMVASTTVKKVLIPKRWLKELAEKEGMTSSDLVAEVYKKVIPDWDAVIEMEHFPRCSDQFTKKMFELSMQLDQHCDGAMVGSVWFNNGFSVDQDIRDSELNYTIEYNPDQIAYDDDKLISKAYGSCEP